MFKSGDICIISNLPISKLMYKNKIVEIQDSFSNGLYSIKNPINGQVLWFHYELKSINNKLARKLYAIK